MSSHHIVREKQEPALLVLGLDHFTDELLGQLLEWSPTVIVTQNTAEQLVSLGIKVDLIVGDDGYNSQAQSDVKYIPVIDETSIEAALKYLVTHNYPAVNIITDEFLLKDYLYFADKINLVIFFNNQKIYPVTTNFTKWKPVGETIELISHPHKLATSGLAHRDQHSYITTHDGFFTLQFDQSFVFIAENIG